MTDDDIYADAACIDTPSSVFFPGPGGHPSNDIYAEARSFCNRCPIRERCLDDHRRERHGMWGGTTPSERESEGWIRVRRGGTPAKSTHRSIRAWVMRHRNESPTTSVIAEATGYSKVTVRTVMRAMEREGHVELTGLRWIVKSGVVR